MTSNVLITRNEDGSYDLHYWDHKEYGLSWQQVCQRIRELEEGCV